MNRRWPGNTVDPTAIIEDGVKMGTGNWIGPYAVIRSCVKLGDDNIIESHSSIGAAAEHSEWFRSIPVGRVIIGSACVIREFTTINAPTTGETRMGNNCIMLRGSHLSHDSVLESGVTLSCNVLVGGHSYIFEGANLGLGSITHQRQTVGAYCFLGAGCVAPKGVDLLPGFIYVGIPAKCLKRNDVGLVRAGIAGTKLGEFVEKYWAMRRPA